MRFSQLRKIAKILFSSEARYTVTRITLFQFADTTSMSVPQFKDFPVRGNQLHPPRSTKINAPTAFAPRTHKLYHSPPPRVNRRNPRHPINRQVRKIPETRQQGTAENLPQQCCAASERGTEWYHHKSHLQHIALQCGNLTREAICNLHLQIARTVCIYRNKEQRLQPYYANIGKRLTKTPKLYFTETGLAACLLGLKTEVQFQDQPVLTLLVPFRGRAGG